MPWIAAATSKLTDTATDKHNPNYFGEQELAVHGQDASRKTTETTMTQPRRRTQMAMAGLLALAIMAASGPLMAANLIQVDYAGDTWLKATTAQASSLPASQKCLLHHREVLEYSSIRQEGVHWHLRLPRAYSGCALTEGYLYQPHISTDSTSLTVHANTVFKKQPVQSSQLGDDQKCSLPAGIYKTSASPQASSGHYAVNFAAMPENCGFSSGYVWNGHSAPGIRAVSLRETTVFKTSTADSSTLPESDRCDIARDTWLLTTEPEGGDRHYRVTLPSAPPGCGFRSGYLFFQPTTFAEPEPPMEAFTWPQPGSDLGSGWCICRNIGTSPHIGQDFVQWGAKRAVAIHDGTVSSISYSASCGYILNLTDQFGGVWRYVHLNRPAVSRGQSVSNGQLLGNISQYPRSGCGTGPHLHLERRSSGLFGDSAVGRSCQSGWRTCFYDPLTPFNGNFQASTGGTVQMPLPLATSVADDAAALSTNSCKIPTDSYARVAPARRDDLVSAARSGELNARVSTTASDDGEQRLLVGNVAIGSNASNRCDLANQQDCAASWQVLAERSDGSYARLFFDAAVRDTALQRVAEEAYCLPEDATGAIDVLVTSAAGSQLHHRATVR